MHVSGTATATIDLPVDQAWAILADHEGMSSWGPGITVTLTTEGSPDRNGVGAVRRIVAPGPAPAIVEEVTAFDQNRYLAYRALSGVPLRDYRGEVELADHDGKTFVSYTVHADSRIPLVEKAAVKGLATGLLAAYARACKKA
ncbi:MAG TPA: SRPBCC family protein [Marmoricola sp.]|nr:SRPBCC family protein [Marmoricola sp.]